MFEPLAALSARRTFSAACKPNGGRFSDRTRCFFFPPPLPLTESSVSVFPLGGKKKLDKVEEEDEEVGWGGGVGLPLVFVKREKRWRLLAGQTGVILLAELLLFPSSYLISAAL